MTLPSTIILPFRPEQISSQDHNQLAIYMRDLVNSLTEMYFNVVDVVNGTLEHFTPTAYGLTTQGTGTYTRQDGWYLRQGLITDVWMDIAWTAHTGTGGLAILLPYTVAKSTNQPWVGTIQSVSASNNFGAGYTYLVWNVEQNSTQGTIMRCGSGVATAQQQIAPIGAYIGHVRYVGQQEA